MFKIIIAGSRSFNNYALLQCTLRSFLINYNYFTVQIVCGGAPGADSLGERWAKEHNVSIRYFFAEWSNLNPPCKIKINRRGERYNALAGFNRNHKMGLYADALVAFWDGVSSGTKDMINCANNRNLQVRVIRYY